MNWIVYLATNKVNGKRYIGVTGKSLAQRRRGHLNRARSGEYACPRFHAAIIKYGAKNFKWKVLAKFSLRVMAYHHEFVLVDTMKPEYNAIPGGQVGPDGPRKNSKSVICLDDGTIYESAAATARALGCDFSEIAKNCRGEIPHVKWRHFRYYERSLSAEERKTLIEEDKALRVAHARRVVQRKSHRTPSHSKKGHRRPVICLDDGHVFDSATLAADAYDVNRSAMSEMCSGYRKWPLNGGFFCYIEDVGQRWVA